MYRLFALAALLGLAVVVSTTNAKAEDDKDKPKNIGEIMKKAHSGASSFRATVAKDLKAKDYESAAKTAKAWVADRAAQAAAQAGDCGALVGVGGDIAVSGPAPARGWAVHVTDDHRSAPTAPGQTVTIRSGGLATSSTAVMILS